MLHKEEEGTEKDGRKTIVPRLRDCDLYKFGFALFEAFDAPPYRQPLRI